MTEEQGHFMSLKRLIFQVEKEGKNFLATYNSMCKGTEGRKILACIVNISVQRDWSMGECVENGRWTQKWRCSGYEWFLISGQGYGYWLMGEGKPL